MKIYDLPVELWRHIFSHLSDREKIHMVVASKCFQAFVDMAEIEAAKAKLFCEGCNMVPNTGLYEDQKCVDCYDGDSCITLARARSVFRLKLADVSRLPCLKPKRSRFGSLMPESVFRFKMVRDAALRKYGKRMNDVLRDLDTAQAALQAKRTKRLRTKLEKFGMPFSDKSALLANDYFTTGKDYKGTLACVLLSACCENVLLERARAIDARLDELGVAEGYYSGLREKYVKNCAGCRNLDRIVQIIAETWAVERSDAAPKSKVERALGIRGLEPRAEGPRWEEYLAGQSHSTLPHLVEEKFEEHLLYHHTYYESYCDTAPLFARRGLDDISVYRELKIRFHATINALSDNDASLEPLCPCGVSLKKGRF